MMSISSTITILGVAANKDFPKKHPIKGTVRQNFLLNDLTCPNDYYVICEKSDNLL